MISRIEAENQIKVLADVSWLSPSQVCAFQELMPFLGGVHRIVNLYGLQGVGKTFLAHILCKEKHVEYTAGPELLRAAELPLIVDNAPFERTEVRGMRNLMRQFDLRQVVLVTRYRVEDSIPAFPLALTPDDVRCFRSNLFRHLDLRLPENSALNLWEHLKLIGGING